MDANSGRVETLPDGVLVVRSVTQEGSGLGRIFRITLGSGEDADPEVTVTSDAAGVHDAVDRWLASLDH